MKIDLHMHSKNCSDGKMTLPEIFQEAHKRAVTVISITDHDSIDCQAAAKNLADQYGIRYIYGLELNITYSHPEYKGGKSVALDFLAYQYDSHYGPLIKKLTDLRIYRERRAEQILEKLNGELEKERLDLFTREDLEEIQKTVDGAFGRPHIANYMVKKGIVSSRQEAFDKYLVKCNVPKMPVSLSEASQLIRDAGGKLVLAHPNDPWGTSLQALTPNLEEQQAIISETMLPYLDGVECWHARHEADTTASYLAFAKKNGLIVTGGSDCHQQPIRIGTLDIPPYVAEQFDI